MPSKLGRNYLNLCFTKIKKPLSTQSSPISHTADHRQTRPFSASATAFLTNYNSLYECTTTFDNNSTSKPFYAAANDGDLDAYFPATAVDFTTAFTSHRFFFSSPGRSNSIVESTTTTTAPVSTTSLSSSDSGGDVLFNNSFAIPTYSPDPYADFRRSMQEMVEAREEMEGTNSSWEFLHELLLCYLALNPKSTHKHIFSAFADLACVIKPSLPPLKSAEEDGSGVRKPSQPAVVVRSPANKMIEIDELFNMGLRKN
ncbi:transcription repressor OFP11-like [Momordica charantia]|uniref:Transcription repressor n=1 Tax=Momordica charantia TaxID=3673 RepID=A0A6J1DA98_MOMCH|nr:transcription repressor OFP11-like [Momordica charantia]